MSFWTSAIGAGVTCLGVVGCYVFWSLMKQLAPAIVGHPLNQKQTFAFAILCASLIFLALLAILTAGYFYLPNRSATDTPTVSNPVDDKQATKSASSLALRPKLAHAEA
jgi:hypothetical protein